MDENRACPRCRAVRGPGESFCSACGFKIQSTPQEQRDRFDRLRSISVKQGQLRKIRTGRGWILAVSVLTLLGGLFFYFVAKSETERQIRDAESRIAGATPEQRAEFDANMKKATGMTWDEAVRHDRGRVAGLLAMNLVLAAVYFGLYLWARSQPFPAALIALLVYLAVLVLNAILDPNMLAQGWLVKIFVIVGLGSAVSAAYQHRKLQEAP